MKIYLLGWLLAVVKNSRHVNCHFSVAQVVRSFVPSTSFSDAFPVRVEVGMLISTVTWAGEFSCFDQIRVKPETSIEKSKSRKSRENFSESLEISNFDRKTGKSTS